MIFGKDDSSSSSSSDEGELDEKGVPIVQKQKAADSDFLMPIGKYR